MIELPKSVVDVFVAAGWHPGRRAAAPSTVPADHLARGILEAFGGKMGTASCTSARTAAASVAA